MAHVPPAQRVAILDQPAALQSLAALMADMLALRQIELGGVATPPGPLRIAA